MINRITPRHAGARSNKRYTTLWGYMAKPYLNRSNLDR